MSEKSVKICDRCGTEVATDPCSICGCDLCPDCDFGAESSLSMEAYIYNSNILWEDMRHEPAAHVCYLCADVIKETPYVMPDHLFKAFVADFNAWVGTLKTSIKEE